MSVDLSAGLRSDTARAIAAGRRPRRWGAWYVALHRFRVMRSYTGTVVVAGIGNPLIYLYALGVGLATIVDTDLDGVSYLVFVAPALLASAAAAIVLVAAMFGGQVAAGVAAVGLVYVVGYMHGKAE